MCVVNELMPATAGSKGLNEKSDMIDLFALMGFVAKGIVYVLIGLLAIQVALGRRGDTEGSQGAIASLSEQPFGFVLLLLLAIGLAAYVLWRLATSILDTERVGSDASGIAKRIGYFVSALSYAALTVLAIQLAAGNSDGEGGDTRQEWTARLMSSEIGTWVVGFIGLTILGVGIYQIYKGLSGSFMKRYSLEKMRDVNRKWANRTGRIGLPARGVVFGIIGYLVIRAAIETDPNDAQGIGGALDTLAEQPFGPWLLGLVAVGFVAYAGYCFIRARYRRFEL